MMQNNVFKQFDEVFSIWSILDKVEKELYMENKWNYVTALYKELWEKYKVQGFLTATETQYVKQLELILAWLNSQKQKVDMELAGEMMKRIGTMMRR